MNNFYFTFGSNEQFPFGFNEYIIIKANTIKEAQNIFKENHPNRPGSNCLNYAFSYTEEEWINSKMCEKYYDNKEPAEILTGDYEYDFDR